ncbi:hypothetical protein F4778DRAFT_323351 [Xylariomycetidae sp. FL2044]|nr:hypothetical protein F4778DRAFT_323351 [Xylariomycetidae sp. FL2044]
MVGHCILCQSTPRTRQCQYLLPLSLSLLPSTTGRETRPAPFKSFVPPLLPPVPFSLPPIPSPLPPFSSCFLLLSHLQKGSVELNTITSIISINHARFSPIDLQVRATHCIIVIVAAVCRRCVYRESSNTANTIIPRLHWHRYTPPFPAAVDKFSLVQISRTIPFHIATRPLPPHLSIHRQIFLSLSLPLILSFL